VTGDAIGSWRSPGGLEFRVSAPQAYRLDDATIAATFRAQLPERVADLLAIAMEVYAFDRLSTRSSRDPFGRGWCRELSPVLAVRDVDFWSSSEVAGTITGLLDWLTDDYWEPCFVPFRGGRSLAETQGTLFSLRPGGTAAVACFSGGLDSFGGTAIDLGEHDDLELVLVGASGTGRARSLQRRLAEALRERTANRVQPLLITANLVHAKGRRQDRQHRSRGLLFLSLAAATALVADVGEVRVYENGIGAVNLAYGRGQVGAHMSRSAHPKTLAAMQHLVDLMDVSSGIRFTLPRVFDTKASIVRRIPDQFADLIGTTMSCDTWSSNRQPRLAEGERYRCGCCSSCVLRRQALRTSGLAELDGRERYRADVLAAEVSDEDAFALRLMLGQVAALEAATRANEPWEAMITAFPQLVDARDGLLVLGDGPDVEDRLVGLYRRYAQEWRQVQAPMVERYLGQVAA